MAHSKQLKELLQAAKEKHVIAMIYEELFKLTRKHAYKLKAMALYHNLFESTGKIVHKQKRDDLEAKRH